MNKGILVKVLVFLIVGLGISWALYDRNQLNSDSFYALLHTSRSFTWILAAALLIPFNHGLEAIKWQYCLRSIQAIKFGAAFKGVLSGYALSFVTPHGIGDYAGRILHLPEAKRLEAVGALLMCRVSQFYITLYLGTIAMVYYLYYQIEVEDSQYWILAGIIICLNVLMLGLISYRKSIIGRFQHVFAKAWIQRVVLPLLGYTQKEILHLFSLALARHVVFCLQFIFLLIYMGIETHWLIFFLGSCFVFLIKSIVPTFLELGVREIAAVIFFGIMEENHTLIIAASLGLWLINFVLPSAIGAFFIFGWKTFSLNSDHDNH
jgi:uncharacterized membrane protein YbhN (UPF0104 family)